MGDELACISVICHYSIPNYLLFVRRELEVEREILFCYIVGGHSGPRKDMWDDYKRNGHQVKRELFP